MKIDVSLDGCAEWGRISGEQFVNGGALEAFATADVTDWVSVTVTIYKSTGKYITEEVVNIPNELSMYDRREFLDGWVRRYEGHEARHFVSLDSNVLGFPWMEPASKGWYDDWESRLVGAITEKKKEG